MCRSEIETLRKLKQSSLIKNLSKPILDTMADSVSAGFVSLGSLDYVGSKRIGTKTNDRK